MADTMTEIVKGTKERLSNITGNVFHVVGENNSLIRLRIDKTGKVLYDKTLARLNSDTLENVRSRLAESPIGSTIAEAKEKGQRSMRKAVTGNPEKKIRDYMKEVPQVKFTDKVSFTFGVICIIFTEFLALRHPEYFTQYYFGLITLLLSHRYIDYRASKYQLFMADFCYFMNLSVILQTGLYPDWLGWYKANYVLCLGCLMAAIVMWKNSLVFHSLDKLTSFFLHAFPCLHLHLLRWGLIPCDAIKMDDSLSLTDVFVLPLILFTIWQVAYLWFTEVLLFERLEKDPQLVTSLRYLAVDKKNGMYILVTKIARSIGVFEKDEVFNPTTMKTKLIFVVAQLIFTMVTILPTPFLYTSYNFSCVYICIIFGLCIWRGGSYYIEVFSERYKLKFVKMEKQVENQESVTTEEEDSDEDHELFHQIVEAINEANGNECTTEPSDHDQVIDIKENNIDEDENHNSFTEDTDSTPDSEKSWEEITTIL